MTFKFIKISDILFIVGLASFVVPAATGQEVIKPDNFRLENDKILVSYQLRPTDGCLNILSVMITVVSSNQKFVAKTISGDLKEVKAGIHQFTWDYKADKVYIDGQVDVSLIAESCNKTIAITKEKLPERNTTGVISPTNYDYRVPYPVGLKIGLAGISVLAGAGAFVIQNNYTNKLNALKKLDVEFNLSPTLSEPQYSVWSKTYSETQAARKTTVINTLIGFSALSAAVDIYLLLSKRNANRRLSFSTSREYPGAAVTLKL